MFNSQQLANEFGVTLSYIQQITKKAADKSVPIIECRGERYIFSKIKGIGGRGKIYQYKHIAKHIPKRRISDDFNINPNNLPKFRNINKPTTKEKFNLVNFIVNSRHPISHIAEIYYMDYDTVKPVSLTAKFKRWIKAFKDKGFKGLEDKRGGKDFKADLDLVKKVVFDIETTSKRDAFRVYCHIYAQKHDKPLNSCIENAHISESAFTRAMRFVNEQ